MKVVKKSDLPPTSLLRKHPYEYMDVFAGVVENSRKITSLDLLKAFFNTAPKWVGVLFGIRNFLVKKMGLKVADEVTNRKDLLQRLKGEKGEKVGFFQVYDSRIDEIILGEDDKHLDFRVSLFWAREDREVIVSTIVRYNNWFGRVYFILIRPFHSIIVRVMVGKMLMQLNALET